MSSFLAFLVPLAVYLVVLGMINRRRRPLLVPGTWDFAGLLFAASGFLLFGGPAILSVIRDRSQMTWLLTPRRSGQGLAGDGYYFWLVLWFLYFLVVVGGSAWLLWKRRNQLAVYNVEPAVFDEALAHALDRLGLSGSRSGRHLLISLGGSPAGRGKHFSAPGLAEGGPFVGLPRHGIQTVDPGEGRRRPSVPGPALELGGGVTQIDFDASPLLRHVTLHWDQVDPPLRQEIESELRQVLAQVHTRRNPVGVWFLLLASSLFFLTFFLTMLAIILPAVANG